MNYIEKEKLIKADIASIENRVRHAFNQGYDLGFKDGKNKQSNCSEISKNSPTETLISLDVYKQVAKERDIAIQQLHELGYDFGQKIEPTTKNDLAVDCILRAKAIEEADKLCLETGYDNEKVIEMLNELPSVTPQEPHSFKWCTDCKEYDQEKHCCHRWSKVIRDTVDEMLEQEPKKGHWIPYLKEGLIVKCSECKSRYTLGYNFCPNCGADMRGNTKRKGNPIEGNNESYNCENWIP